MFARVLILYSAIVFMTAQGQGGAPTQEEINAVECPFKKCPSSGKCCEDDQFCLSGNCHTCFPEALGEDDESICAWCREIGYRHNAGMIAPYPCRTACTTRCGPENVDQGADSTSSTSSIVVSVLLAVAVSIIAAMLLCYIYQRCKTGKGGKNWCMPQEDQIMKKNDNERLENTRSTGQGDVNDNAEENANLLPLGNQVSNKGIVDNTDSKTPTSPEPQANAGSTGNGSFSSNRSQTALLENSARTATGHPDGANVPVNVEHGQQPNDNDTGDASVPLIGGQGQQPNDNDTGDANTTTRLDSRHEAEVQVNGPKFSETNEPHPSGVVTNQTSYTTE